MVEHRKKMIAPIVVTVLFVIYYIVYFCAIIKLLTGFLRILFGILPIVLSAVMVFVCIERIKEIKGGEEDDLGKY